MRYFTKTMLIILLYAILGISTAQAFSFDFGDDDYPYWRGPQYYRPWVAPPLYYYPRLPSFDRSSMVRNRQRRMENFDTTMERLDDLLYGSRGFDRAEAIKLARKIEMTSGMVLTDKFHPGSVVDFRSDASTALWGNEQVFKANALAMEAAASDLAMEFEKQPTAEEGAVDLPKRRSRFDRDDDGPETVQVSAGIWQKYNVLSNICLSCHGRFRRGW